MREACIFNIQRYSLHDGGGIRTIVFFKGCCCTCPWCCNPESLSLQPQLFYKQSQCINCSNKVDGICSTDVEHCPTGAKEMVGEIKSVEEVFDIVKRDQVFYDTSGGGVTLSGGEFLLQQDFALELLRMCKEEGIHTAVETTLSLQIKEMEELVSLVDVFLVDFKIMEPKQSKEILHLDVEKMKENVKEIQRLHGHVIARVPLIPTYTATKDNLLAIIDVLKALQLKEIHLLPFHQLGSSKYRSIGTKYVCEALPILQDQEVKDIETMFKHHGFQTNVHGA